MRFASKASNAKRRLKSCISSFCVPVATKLRAGAAMLTGGREAGGAHDIFNGAAALDLPNPPNVGLDAATSEGGVGDSSGCAISLLLGVSTWCEVVAGTLSRYRLERRPDKLTMLSSSSSESGMTFGYCAESVELEPVIG